MKARIYKMLMMAWLSSPWDSTEAWLLDAELHQMEKTDPNLFKFFYTYGN